MIAEKVAGSGGFSLQGGEGGAVFLVTGMVFAELLLGGFPQVVAVDFEGVGKPLVSCVDGDG